MEFENNVYFWQKIDTLYLSGDLVINKPKNSTHNTYKNLIYPFDYGYIEENTDETIRVYKGSNESTQVDAVVVCVDILKKDVEVKLLVGCNDDETKAILEFLNQTDFQKTVIIRRGNNLPSWAMKD